MSYPFANGGGQTANVWLRSPVAEAAAAPAADAAVVQGGQALALTVARAAADDAIRTRLLAGR